MESKINFLRLNFENLKKIVYEEEQEINMDDVNKIEIEFDRIRFSIKHIRRDIYKWNTEHKQEFRGYDEINELFNIMQEYRRDEYMINLKELKQILKDNEKLYNIFKNKVMILIIKN